MKNEFLIKIPSDIGKQKQKVSLENIQKAKSKIVNKKRKPSCHCFICKKTIEEIRGKRIVVQKTLGAYLLKTYHGAGYFLVFFLVR